MSDPRGLDPLGTADEQNLDTDDPIVESLFPEDEPEPVVKRQVTVRGVAIVGARVVTGVAGLAVAAVVIGGASLLPIPTLRSQPASVVVTPVPTAQQVVCAGAVLRLSDETGQGATIPSAVGGGPALDYDASDGEVEAVPLGTSDAGTGGTFEAPLARQHPAGEPGDPGAGQRRPVRDGRRGRLRRARLERLRTGQCRQLVPVGLHRRRTDHAAHTVEPDRGAGDRRHRDLRRRRAGLGARYQRDHRAAERPAGAVGGRVRTRPRHTGRARHEHRRPGRRQPPAVHRARARRRRARHRRSGGRPGDRHRGPGARDPERRGSAAAGRRAARTTWMCRP